MAAVGRISKEKGKSSLDYIAQQLPKVDSNNLGVGEDRYFVKISSWFGLKLKILLQCILCLDCDMLWCFVIPSCGRVLDFSSTRDMRSRLYVLQCCVRSRCCAASTRHSWWSPSLSSRLSTSALTAPMPLLGSTFSSSTMSTMK